MSDQEKFYKPDIFPKDVLDKVNRFEWKQIHGKTLEIHVSEDTDIAGTITVVGGIERSTGKIYILRTERTSLK